VSLLLRRADFSTERFQFIPISSHPHQSTFNGHQLLLVCCGPSLAGQPWTYKLLLRLDSCG
jgi:hypothetical protein